MGEICKTIEKRENRISEVERGKEREYKRVAKIGELLISYKKRVSQSPVSC